MLWNSDWFRRLVATLALSVRVRRRRRKSFNWGPERLETRTLLSAYFVNAAADLPDFNPGDDVAAAADGSTTLRAAIEEANANSGRDIVVLPAGLFELSQGLFGTLEAAGGLGEAGGPLTITDDLTILGAGSDRTTINALALDQAFVLSDLTALRIDSLTVLSRAAVEPVAGSGHVVEFSDAVILSAPVDSPGNAADSPGNVTDDASAAAADELVVSNLPKNDGTFVTTNDRQAELLSVLYGQNLPASRALLEPLPMPSSPALSGSSARLDITLDSGRPTQLAAAGTPPKWQNPDQSENAPRLANRSAEIPAEVRQQRRDDVINSLFEEPGHRLSLPAADDATSVQTVSGISDKQPARRPASVPTPEDVAPGDVTTELDGIEAVTGEAFDVPVLIPQDEASSPGPVDLPVKNAPLLLPPSFDSGPLLLPDREELPELSPATPTGTSAGSAGNELNNRGDASSNLSHESSSVEHETGSSGYELAGLLFLAVRPVNWRRVLRRWRRRVRKSSV